MNEVTIKGEIVFVDEVREYGSNGFRKHQVVVETGDGKWANPVPVEFIKDTIEQSKDLKKGEKVSIDARINGREWQGKDGVTKWFTSISGYKIQSEGDSPHPSNEPDSSSFDTLDEYDDGIEDDVPF
ncbi:MAG: DUF3127 domain-containing protein [Opitutae bacterium]|jgi:hypothetical protein|nr:DUF3127 domain-containing protein [Opitutae bacterium]